jgi:Tfp pilus assembly protein PilN
MRNLILKYLSYGNHFCGIEHTSKNGKKAIIVTILRQSKNELLVDASFEVSNLEDIVKKTPKDQHIHLVINNDNVLAKVIESEQQEPLKLVYKAFPNINLDDFYYEVLSETNTHYIALCRRDYVEVIIGKYFGLKLSVINISLGNTLVGGISGFINQNPVFTSNAKISIENNQIHQFESTGISSETYSINGLNINNQQLLSFSGALENVLGNNNAQTNFSDRLIELKHDFKHTRFFNLFLKGGGLFILGLLLINFFFFNHYFNETNELRQLSEVNQSTKNQILELDKIVSKKQKMVDDLLKSSGSKSSFYTSEIVNSLPSSILLNELNYQPILKRIKLGKEIELKENTIEVTGASNDSEAFSNWISDLEREEWVSKIDILDYGRNSSKFSDFKIEIKLKND